MYAFLRSFPGFLRRSHGFRGGVHPQARKHQTAPRAIEILPIPKRLYLPVQQHIGAAAEPVVQTGQQVLKGQLIAQGQSGISASVHASSSGTIVEIAPCTAPHPSGLSILTIVIETDGEDRWVTTQAPVNPFILEPAEIAKRVADAGIVGMGGATFPSAIKLHLGLKNPIDTLIINGSECEPYLSCDDRLMRERSAEVVSGVRILMHTVQATRAIIAVEDNKPEALAALEAACAAMDIPVIQPLKLPTRYPMGSEKHMVRTLTGREIPAGKLGADIGVMVHNVGTAYAVHQAVVNHRPLVSRIVTVGGGAIQRAANLEVPIGTLLEDILAFCGGLTETPERLLMGGPMMGQVMPHAKVPIIKGSNGVIALSREEIIPPQNSPCIHCARCVDACPCGLMPLKMSARIQHDDLEGALGYGLQDCIACGACSYVCPAHIPLVHYFNHAKGELNTQRIQAKRNEEIKQLAEKRRQRLEAEAKAKAELAKTRKAARAKVAKPPPKPADTAAKAPDTTAEKESF